MGRNQPKDENDEKHFIRYVFRQEKHIAIGRFAESTWYTENGFVSG
jgi:hypothetical protein